MKPISFSSSMVRALLNTKADIWPAEPIDPSKPTKSQTRRVVKLAAPHRTFSFCHKHPGGGFQFSSMPEFIDQGSEHGKLPPYAVGDVLYVREGLLRVSDAEDPHDWAEYDADGRTVFSSEQGEHCECLVWRWNCDKLRATVMPKEAARLWVEVKGVRAERLQDRESVLFTKDCWAEGYPGKSACMGPIVWFMELWDELNAKRGYPWVSNPHNWRISFMRTEKHADENTVDG